MITIRSEADLKIFDCTINDDPSSYIAFHQSHIPSASFIDSQVFQKHDIKVPKYAPGR
jgi:3-mercaptopyruvate sulfurtransferase SseA